MAWGSGDGRAGGGRAGGRPEQIAEPGQSVDPGLRADPESVARAIVLRRLTTAPRTRSQLVDDLRRKSVPDDVAQRVLDRFGEVGLVDDGAFAQMWVRSRHEGRGLARRALGHELRHRGVDDETVARALDQVDDDAEAAAAAALVSRRLPATRGLARDVRVRRLVGMLARKGYAGGLAVRVVIDTLDLDTAAPDLQDGWSEGLDLADDP